MDIHPDRSAAVADNKCRGDKPLDCRKILITVLDNVNKRLGGEATDFSERLLDAGDRGIEEIKEAVVVERDDANLLRHIDSKLPERADRSKKDGL